MNQSFYISQGVFDLVLIIFLLSLVCIVVWQVKVIFLLVVFLFSILMFAHFLHCLVYFIPL